MRVCMFCQGKASTREDVWPSWLTRRAPVSGTARIYAERRELNLGSWPIKQPKLLVKWLCRSCNNGWMSRLESEAKPVIESILDDTLDNLDASAQMTLAVWAAKTAMVLEAVDSDRIWFYSEDERNLMRVARVIPVRTSIWIAKCVDQSSVYSAAENLRTTLDDDGIHAYATTMAFGSLAIQVVTIRTPVMIPAGVAVTYDVSEGPWDQTLVQVWPITQASQLWPPKHGLVGELGLDALTKRLGPSM